jgi:hypothetical protein
MEFAPLGTRFSRVQNSTQGCSILSRYDLFQRSNGQQEPPLPQLPRLGPWSAKECEKLRELIFAGRRDVESIRPLLPDRSPAAIKRQVTELYKS